MKKLSIVVLMLGIVLISGCVGNDGYSSTSWEKVYDKNAGDRITIEGYLMDADQYPTSIFRKDETYAYLSPNNDYPLQGQIPLIITSTIDCSSKVKVYGTIVLREGSAGMGVPGSAEYTVLKVDKWSCVN